MGIATDLIFVLKFYSLYTQSSLGHFHKHFEYNLHSRIFTFMLSASFTEFSWWCQATTTANAKLCGGILTVLISLFWILRNINKSKTLNPPPPGPSGLPILGYIPFLGTHLHRTFADLAKIHGPIFKLKLGMKLCVVISSPSLAKEVVRDHDVVFANRDSPIAGSIASFGASDIAFSSYGSHWRKMRKIFVREMLSNLNINASYNLRKQEIIRSIQKVNNEIGKPIDVGNLAFQTAVNSVMCMVVGGMQQGEKRTKVVETFRKVVGDLMILVGHPNVSDYFPVLARFDLQGVEKRTRKIVRSCEEFLDSAIEQRKKIMMEVRKEMDGKNEQRKDFLQILLELQTHEDEEMKINTTEVKALLMDILIGGTDTTATTIEWVMTKLLMHPEVMKKVNQELTQVIGPNNTVEECHLPNLQYLNAVIRETLRLHPTLPLLVPRRSSESCVIGGFTIPKETTVFINVWAIHRDPELWENPLEFQPDRFLINPTKLDLSGQNLEFFPLGSGRRACAGLQLAERMLMYFLASFLHTFDWELPEGEELEDSDKFGIVVKKSQPLIAIPKAKEKL